MKDSLEEAQFSYEDAKAKHSIICQRWHEQLKCSYYAGPPSAGGIEGDVVAQPAVATQSHNDTPSYGDGSDTAAVRGLPVSLL